MLVVADSSPLIVLIELGHVELLPRLFGEIIIPPQVSAELRQSNRPQAILSFMAARPLWLHERAPAAIEPIPTLDAGELAAISLARELKADLLLIDEVRGRKAAADRHIPFTGTIGVVELAASQELLDLQDAFTRLKSTNFWISPELLDERLRIHQPGKTPT